MTNKITIPNVILLAEVERMLKEGINVTLRTKGNSMLPFIHGGKDSVILTGTFLLRKGDIVLAKTDKENYVLHRIIEIDNQTVTLMGDGNLRGTEICHTENICGKVITILQNGKKIDPYSRKARLLSVYWFRLLPIRKYLLAIYRTICPQEQ